MSLDLQFLFKKVTRLFDIVTQEISLVDKAANKRVFLLAKNDGDRFVDAVMVEKDDEGFKSSGKPLYTINPNTKENLNEVLKLSVQALEKSCSEDDFSGIVQIYDSVAKLAGVENVKKGDINPMTKEEALRVISECLEVMVMIGEGVRDAEVDDSAPEQLPQPVADSLMELAYKLAMFVMETGTDENMSDDMDDMPEDSYKGLDNIKSALQEIKSDSITKRGRKMNSARLKQLEQVVESLVRILSEVGSRLSVDSDKGKSYDQKKSEDSNIKKLELEVANFIKVNQDLKERVNALELELSRKTAELTKFESIPCPSNGLANVTSTAAKSNNVDWPRDMNDYELS